MTRSKFLDKSKSQRMDWPRVLQILNRISGTLKEGHRTCEGSGHSSARRMLLEKLNES
jgi:hypothetical protein